MTQAFYTFFYTEPDSTSTASKTFPLDKHFSLLSFFFPGISKMFYASVVCLSWALASLPLTHGIPVGGAEPLRVVDVVGAPSDDVSCPVRKLTRARPLPISEN